MLPSFLYSYNIFLRSLYNNDISCLHDTCSVKIIKGDNVIDFNISVTSCTGLLLRCAGTLPHGLGKVDKL